MAFAKGRSSYNVMGRGPRYILWSLELGTFFRKQLKELPLNMSEQFHFTGFLYGNQVDQIWPLTDVESKPRAMFPTFIG
ncbi:MAG: hypothetical protein WD824_15455 [Cyclobacteriaceae bacterium]